MRIKSISDVTGVAELDGIEHAIDLSLLENIKIGDYVIVHAGFALHILDETEADARLVLFDELAAARAAAAP